MELFKLIILALSLILIISSGCGDTGIKSEIALIPEGYITNILQCGEYAPRPHNNQITGCCSCVDYIFDEGTLTITHSGASFNCCADVYAVININENNINIEEKEGGEACYCQCLYQLEYEITDLPFGDYNIILIEPNLLEGDDPLNFSIDLKEDSAGVFCVERDHYPWNEN